MSINYNAKQNGGRFMDLCLVFEVMRNGTLPNLLYILQALVNARAVEYSATRTHFHVVNGELNEDICELWDGKKDGRVQLPNEVIHWLMTNPNPHWRLDFDRNGRPSGGSKVTLTWIVCYLNNNLPNPTIEGWENFECSHICLCAGNGNKSDYVCLLPKHLVWESSSENQSRGYELCMKMCHCGCGDTLCRVSNLHNPHCV